MGNKKNLKLNTQFSELQIYIGTHSTLKVIELECSRL